MPASTACILVVARDHEHGTIVDALRGMPHAFEVRTARTLAGALAAAAAAPPDLALIDLELADSHGLDTLGRFVGAVPDVPVIVLARPADEPTGLEAVRAGAQDSVVQGQNFETGSPGGRALEKAVVHALELHRARTEMRALADIGRELLQTLDVEQLWMRIATTARRLVRAERTVLYERAPDDWLVCVAADGGNTEGLVGLRMPPGQAASGRAVREGRPVVSDDQLHDAGLTTPPWLLDRLAHDALRVVVSVPLAARGRILGALAVSDHLGRRFGVEEIRLLSAMADLAAVALDNAAVHAAAVRRGEELDALARAGAAVTERIDLDVVLTRIAGEAARIARTPHVKLLLVDRAAGVLRPAAVLGATVSPDFVVPIGASYSGTVVVTGTPIFIGDTQNDPRNLLAARDREQGLRTFLGLPVAVRGEVLAVLTFNTEAPREYSDEELASLASFARQAATAIDNAHLHRELGRRLRRTETLLAISQVLGGTLDLTETMRRVAREIVRCLGAAFGGAYLTDESTGSLVPVAGYRLRSPFVVAHRTTTLPIAGDPLLSEALDTGRAVWVPDVVHDARVGAAIRALGLPRALLVVPIVVQGALAGAFLVAWQATRPEFDDDERALVEGIGRQAAVVLANVRLHAESERRRRAAEALADVSRHLADSLDVETIGSRIVERVPWLLGGVASALWLRQPDGSLRAVAAGGTAGAHLRGHVLARGEGLAGRVVAEGRFVVVDDILHAPGLTVAPALREAIRAAGYDSAVAVPLRVKGEITGALSLGDVRGRRYTDAEVALLEAFADQAALALRNALLFEESERRRRAAERLADLGRTLAEELDPGVVGQRVVDSVRELLGARSAAMYRHVDGEMVLAESSHGSEPAFPWTPRLPRGTGLTIARSGAQSLLAVPMRVKDQPVGALCVGDTTGRSYDVEMVRLAQTFADTAALALENARLYDETDRRRRSAEVMATLGRSINASLDRDTVLAGIADGARELCRADLARVCLRHPVSDAMEIRYWCSGPHAGSDGRCEEPSRGCAVLMRTGAPFRTDLAADAGVPGAAAPDGAIASEMIVPITIDGRVEGVLYVGNHSRRLFTDADEETLLRLADHAALAIKNAALFAREQEARQAAERSERRYRRLFDEVPVGLFQTDAHGRFLAVNATMARMLGYPDAETLQALPTSVIYAEPADRERLLAVMKEEGRVRDYEFRNRRADGTEIWVRHTTQVVRGSGGDIVGYEGAVEDITDRRRAEDALSETEAQVRQLQKLDAVGRLAGGIAHDFNNLLAVLCGRSELVLQHMTDGGRVRRDVEMIRTTAERASRLTKQLLAFSRKQVLEPRVVDLNDVVRGVVPMLRRVIREDVELAVVPAASGRVRADVTQLEQVIMNLALNARDAMPDGGRLTIETVDVDVGVHAHANGHSGPCTALIVSDTGIGMTPDVLSHVFEPFFTTKERGKGTGLGLATVYGIVRQSGGRIIAWSEPGRGARFSVCLPRIEDAVEAEAPATTSSGTPTGHETVLLVEDDHEVRRIARDVLESYGYRVLEAEGPEPAVSLSETFPASIDVLLTDVVMPGTNGLRLAERLRRTRPGLRVVYMSGYSDTGSTEGVTLDPGTPFVQKPFSTEALARKVREALDGA